MLRHWDEIGLVSPARTSGGHRCCTAVEVARLYQVMALRSMGVSLMQARALLTGQDLSPVTTLRAHLRRVEVDLARGCALRQRLIDVLAVLEAPATALDGSAEGALLMKVIEKMTMFDQHLDPAQREAFDRRRGEVGEQAWQDALDAWPQLITAVRTEMDADTDPADP